MYSILYNGEKSENYGLILNDYPEISYPQDRTEIITVPGKNGGILSGDAGYDDVEIVCTFSLVGESREEWNKRIRACKRWLRGDGDKRLQMSDDPEYYYRVKKVTVDSITRELAHFAILAVTFICHPYKYVVGGSERMEPHEKLYNAYDTAYPVYYIEGEGTCILSVNGSKMTANVSQSITIDTERQIAYRTDGSEMNTAVNGDYEDLYLKHGENSIAVSPKFKLQVAPMWGELV